MNQMAKPDVVYIVLACLALIVPPIDLVQGVCDEGAIRMVRTTEMIRVGNNTARAYAATMISGRWALW